MLIELIDCNNWIRKVYEKDTSGLALRNQFTDAFYSPNPRIYVFDGTDGKASRRKIFSGYKEGRTGASDEFYIQLELFKLLIECTNKTMICVPYFEADDVIAALIKGGGFEGCEVEIRSTDGDFLILCEEGVRVSEPSKKLAHVPREHLRLYKTLIGDTSDNIKGLPSFGPKTFTKILENGQEDFWYGILEARTTGGIKREDLMLTAAQYLWLEANFDLLLAYWDIINFIPVPQDLMDQHTKQGTPNYKAAEAILATIFQ